MYFTVCENYDGSLDVCSFMGKTTRQEREYALTAVKRVIGIYSALEPAKYALRIANAKSLDRQRQKGTMP